MKLSLKSHIYCLLSKVHIKHDSKNVKLIDSMISIVCVFDLGYNFVGRFTAIC